MKLLTFHQWDDGKECFIVPSHVIALGSYQQSGCYIDFDDGHEGYYRELPETVRAMLEAS